MYAVHGNTKFYKGDSSVDSNDMDRVAIHWKLLSEGFMLYSLLEMKQRYLVEGIYILWYEYL